MSKLFHNASSAFKLANSTLLNSCAIEGMSRKGRGRMNKTEAEFALRLEAMKRAGEILRYEFEGITLRWVDMRYTPDFVVFGYEPDMGSGRFGDPVLTLIEVKGAHIWSRDIVRFKGARAFWPEFTFEMHQKTKQGWNRIH